MTVLKAIDMYNLISETEDRLANGERIEGLDKKQMYETKKKVKRVIEKELHIKVR